MKEEKSLGKESLCEIVRHEMIYSSPTCGLLAEWQQANKEIDINVAAKKKTIVFLFLQKKVHHLFLMIGNNKTLQPSYLWFWVLFWKVMHFYRR